jgi:hypothetical protein
LALFDLGPILVVAKAPAEDYERHISARIALGDAIEGDRRYRDLLTIWRDSELQAHAANANEELSAVIAEANPPATEPVILADGTLGWLLEGRRELDDPAPPSDAVIRVGPFVDKLIAGQATLEDFAELFTAADAVEGRSLDIDARSERPLGTAARHMAIVNDAESRAARGRVEAPLRRMTEIWGDGDLRIDEALGLVTALHLDTWPFLATDLVRRYAAGLEGKALGKRLALEYRLGDPALGAEEPPNLDIPAFATSGDAATDLVRINAWESRVASVKETLARAAKAGERKHPPSRRMHPDERAGYRRDARWLFENRADRVALRALAQRDLGSREAWREIQRGVSRAKKALSIGRNYNPVLDAR